MFGLSGLFSSDLAMDLGTANTLVDIKNRGIVLNEPSVVALQRRGGKAEILAVGTAAKSMLGRTPERIEAIRPMRDGVIADFDLARALIKDFIKRVNKHSFLSRPFALICVPSGATPVEMRAIRDSAMEAGVRSVKLIPEPIAAI